MLISEIYESKQGEGLLTGEESIFIRTSGCNLRCQFCDTPFTSWKPEGEQHTLQEILKAVSEYRARHIVLTGGEPLIARDVERLTRELKQAGFHITIETAGTVFKEVACDLMSISPKMANSTPSEERAGEWSRRHERTRLNVSVANQLMKLCEYQLKFVVANPGDLAEIEAFLTQLDSFDPRRVLLMPEGTDQATLEARANWLQPLCDENGFVFCQRKHIFWYGNKRGT